MYCIHDNNNNKGCLWSQGSFSRWQIKNSTFLIFTIVACKSFLSHCLIFVQRTANFESDKVSETSPLLQDQGEFWLEFYSLTHTHTHALTHAHTNQSALNARTHVRNWLPVSAMLEKGGFWALIGRKKLRDWENLTSLGVLEQCQRMSFRCTT